MVDKVPNSEDFCLPAAIKPIIVPLAPERDRERCKHNRRDILVVVRQRPLTRQL